MNKSEQDRAKFLITANQMPMEQAGAMLEAMAGVPLIRPVENNPQGTKTIHMTLDGRGEVLVAGKNYWYRNSKIKVLREEFGGGNILDTYYRIWYMNTDLEERFFCVNARYPRGIFQGAQYQSDLLPVETHA